MSYFQLSHKELDNRNIPRLKEYTSEVILKNIDFRKQIDEGNIQYRSDGVYLLFKGKWLRGYYYMKNYNIDIHGLPKFHLLNCTTMQQRELFHGDYIWSNASTVDVIQRGTNKLHENNKLKLCYNCQRELINAINDTVDFFEETDQEVIDIDDIVGSVMPSEELNIFGYPYNWRQIATMFKSERKLKCNQCNIKIEDKSLSFYFDVDHINGYNKADCSSSNLQILCKLCHTYKDEHHRNNAITYPHRNETLHEFVRNYKPKLEKSKNQYVKRYFQDFKHFLND